MVPALIEVDALPNEICRSAPWAIVSSTRAPTRALPWPVLLKDQEEFSSRSLSTSAPPTTILDLLVISVAMAYPTGTISPVLPTILRTSASSLGVKAPEFLVITTFAPKPRNSRLSLPSRSEYIVRAAVAIVATTATETSAVKARSLRTQAAFKSRRRRSWVRVMRRLAGQPLDQTAWPYARRRRCRGTLPARQQRALPPKLPDGPRWRSRRYFDRCGGPAQRRQENRSGHRR